MRTRSPSLALGVVGVLGGCAGAVPVIDFYDADSATLRRFETMQVLDTTKLPSTGYQILGAVDGLYCKFWDQTASVDDPLAQAEAVEQVMLKASELGATHISTPTCEISYSFSAANNCSASVICSGHALRAQGE